MISDLGPLISIHSQNIALNLDSIDAGLTDDAADGAAEFKFIG